MEGGSCGGKICIRRESPGDVSNATHFPQKNNILRETLTPKTPKPKARKNMSRTNGVGQSIIRNFFEGSPGLKQVRDTEKRSSTK